MSDFEVEVRGKKHTLYFKRPNQEELFEIDFMYRKSLAELVRSGCLMEAEAEKIFKKSNAWGDEEENEIKRCSDKIAKLILVIESLSEKYDEGKMTDEEKDKAIEAIRLITENRGRLNQLIRKRIELFYNTAESQANEQKMHRFAELCCYDKETGRRFFDSHEEYTDFLVEHSDIASAIFREIHHFEYGKPDNVEETWTEVKFLNKLGEEAQRKIEEADKKKKDKAKRRKRSKTAKKTKKNNRKK